MPPIVKNRIASIDLLKGLVMVIMALDHVRDYVHEAAFYFDPTDPTRTSIPIFFTRWITHYCAPTFSLLAGLSAYFAGRRKTKAQLSAFLFKRGLWLVFIEVVVATFAWFFDPGFHNLGLFVIWALGVSMIVLAGLIHLPNGAITAISLVIIFGHNALDGIHMEGSFLWAMLHDGGRFVISDNRVFEIGYPLIPWIAVMSLGYSLGKIYEESFGEKRRRKMLLLMGATFILLFVALRYINVYGDQRDWTQFASSKQKLLAFLDPLKYPPSLLYLLMTLGPGFILMALFEKAKGPVVNFFSTFGRVPFFYYVLHLYVIHLVALLLAKATGYGWAMWGMKEWVSFVPELKGYGVSLFGTYLIWIAIIVLLYPFCKKFETYKLSHKEKWWLSYL
jgi:uncharacterized membrane protein